MRIIIGNPARDEDFLPRRDEMKKILDAINSLQNFQISAPRRIGKTSLLYYYYDNPPPDCIVIFVDTESVNSVNGFYKKLCQKILENENISEKKSLIDQLSQSTNRFLKKIKGFQILGNTIELKDDNDVDYLEELTNFLKGIDLGGSRIILMIDEFPEAITNILDKLPEDFEKATLLLSTNRALRQDPDLNRKIQFIYTGSISLNLTVNQFGASRFINDLTSVQIGALKPEEAEELITRVLETYGYEIAPEQIDYFIKKLGWLIVSQVQMLIEELRQLVSPGDRITDDSVDMAFNNLLDKKHQHYFDHYVSRLNRAFKSNELDLAKQILGHCAKQGAINLNEVKNLAEGTGAQQSTKIILAGLEYDGYINSVEDHTTFKFNSPLLQMWWKKHICDA